MCSTQMERIFNTTRIPGIETGKHRSVIIDQCNLKTKLAFMDFAVGLSKKVDILTPIDTKNLYQIRYSFAAVLITTVPSSPPPIDTKLHTKDGQVNPNSDLYFILFIFILVVDYRLTV